MNLNVIFASFFAADIMNEIDLPTLEEYCYKLESKTPGRVKSNVGGWQSEDLIQTQEPIYSLVKRLVLSASPIIDYCRFTGKIGIDNIWVNINRKYHSNRTHNHPDSLISGTFYVKVPENSGNIVFENPNEQLRHYLTPQVKSYNEINSVEWFVTPRPGMVLYFPSYLKHFVDQNKSEEDRISLSFNIGLFKETKEEQINPVFNIRNETANTPIPVFSY